MEGDDDKDIKVGRQVHKLIEIHQWRKKVRQTKRYRQLSEGGNEEDRQEGRCKDGYK